MQSSAGYSKRFVRAAVPELPPGVEIRASGAVLSALRKAADGDKVALLLDGAQSAALGKLPFASSLAVIATSPPFPVAVVATVGKRMDGSRWKGLEPAFKRVADDPAAREVDRDRSCAPSVRERMRQTDRQRRVVRRRRRRGDGCSDGGCEEKVATAHRNQCCETDDEPSRGWVRPGPKMGRAAHSGREGGVR